ncbi:hypothetical protein ACLK19_16650 [Escherichia coli]
MLESAMRHVNNLNRLNFNQFEVSVKASNVFPLLSLSFAGTNKSIAAELGSPKPWYAQRGGQNTPLVEVCCCLKASATRCAYAGGQSDRRDQGQFSIF